MDSFEYDAQSQHYCTRNGRAGNERREIGVSGLVSEDCRRLGARNHAPSCRHAQVDGWFAGTGSLAEAPLELLTTSFSSLLGLK